MSFPGQNGSFEVNWVMVSGFDDRVIRKSTWVVEWDAKGVKSSGLNGEGFSTWGVNSGEGGMIDLQI